MQCSVTSKWMLCVKCAKGPALQQPASCCPNASGVCKQLKPARMGSTEQGYMPLVHPLSTGLESLFCNSLAKAEGLGLSSPAAPDSVQVARSQSSAGCIKQACSQSRRTVLHEGLQVVAREGLHEGQEKAVAEVRPPVGACKESRGRLACSGGNTALCRTVQC